MRFRMLALAGAAVLFAGAALADDPMANTYANSIVTKDKATGATATLFFNKDMTYTLKTTDPKGQPVSIAGTWMLKDNGATICLTPTVPAGTPAPQPSCSPLQAHNVGDNWTVTNDMKQTYDVTLTAGR